MDATVSTLSLESNDVDEWVHCDSNDVGYERLTDEQIAQEISQQESQKK